jgi:ParB/RepB/Spo0J family partition protein
MLTVTTPKNETKPLDWFKPDQGELDRHDDPEETRRLGEDMQANGQLQPVAATEDGRIIFGHGRWKGAKEFGIPTLEVKIFPAMSDTQFALTRAAENLQRKELTPYRRWRLCADLMCINSHWQQTDLARHLHLHPSQVGRLLSPSKCVQEAQDALKAGKITISDTDTLSKEDEATQVEMLAEKLAGNIEGRDALKRYGRRKRATATPAVRASKIKVPLVSGTVVTVAGDDISLEEAIDAANDAVKQMKAAVAKGLNAKTAMNVWKDVAAAG